MTRHLLRRSPSASVRRADLALVHQGEKRTLSWDQVLPEVVRLASLLDALLPPTGHAFDRGTQPPDGDRVMRQAFNLADALDRAGWPSAPLRAHVELVADELFLLRVLSQ